MLESLTLQTYRHFEVLVVEDGSQVRAETVVQHFAESLTLIYLYKPNSGPGLSRNYGAERASGDYFIFLDSDCIIPSHYLEEVNHTLTQAYADAFGGPDKAAPAFNRIQKAISYAMTSFLTTGGIRGGHKRLDKFYPRSFNMGYSREVYERTKGFAAMRFGEDIDISIRVFQLGFRVKLIENAYVYHKRRTDFRKFFKQVFNSGMARITLSQKHPGTLKPVHLLPSAFTLGSGLLLLLAVLADWKFLLPLLGLMGLWWTDATVQHKNPVIGLLAVPASLIQLAGYGSGFLYAFWQNIILRKEKTEAFKHTF